MRIGELARKTGCSIQTIRFYEKKGLLEKPARSEGNYRLYDKTAADKLMFIKQCRSLDISMNEISILLAQKSTPNKSCASVNHLIDEHLVQVDKKIQELLHLKTELAQIAKKCSSDKTIKHCGILSELESE